MSELIFKKYHGLGNDYLVYDCLKNGKQLASPMIKAVCDRNFGLGSDGMLIGPVSENGIPGVRIFNPDGSEAEKSGNGVRIFSAYLKDAGYVKSNAFDLHTLGGTVSVTFLDDTGKAMRVSMGRLSFDSGDVGAVGTPQTLVDVPLEFGGKAYRCTCVSVGNPHCVIPMDEISKEKVCEIGQYSETANYFPNHINTQIVKVLDRNNIQIEIYERGAGYTLASGSSSCAAAGAVYQLGLADSPVTVHMPGGALEIEISKDLDVFMTGPVVYVGTMLLSEDFFETLPT